MSGIDLNSFLKGFGAKRLYTQSLNTRNVDTGQQKPPQTENSIPKQIIQQPAIKATSLNLQNLQMKSSERAIYARDLLKMPTNLNEFIYMTQRGITLKDFNKIMQFPKMYGNINPTQISQELNTLSSELSTLENIENLTKNMINLNQLSELFQKNGKEAITKIIMAMAENSKAGITDLNQLKEMAKFINANIAIASENNPQKTLKLLIMLYLPWLPLTDGVGFDLELGSTTEEETEEDTILRISITTKNYGLIKVTIFLETSNSVQITLECGKSFPQKELLEKINQEKKHYSLDAVTSFIVNKDSSANSKETKTAVNMSNVNKINPYLLLIGHSIIKNIIEIDNNY